MLRTRFPFTLNVAANRRYPLGTLTGFLFYLSHSVSISVLPFSQSLFDETPVFAKVGSADALIASRSEITSVS